jgi:hypothetical protein
MQIAEDIVKQGMTSSGAFNEALEAFVANQRIKTVIETGTYLGEGTTKAIIKGLQSHGEPFQFFSIEVNPSHYSKAVMNVGKIEGVFLLNGLSISKSDLPKQVEFTDFPEWVVVDYQEKVREKSYITEVNYNVKDNILYECLKAVDCKPDLVVLDSAGHIGEIEFDELMKWVQGKFYLALDDINHVKHYKTVQKIKQDERFKIVWETSDKFGSLIAEVSVS